jgi:hypothetical protein
MNQTEMIKTFPKDLKELNVQFSTEEKDALSKLKNLVTAAKDGSFR